MRQRPGEKILRPIHANVGIGVDYRRALMKLVDQMTASYDWHIRAAYRANPPRMEKIATDAAPADELQKILKQLGIRWDKRINALAPKLAAYFNTAVSRRSDAALKKMLRDAGVTVRVAPMTPVLRDVMKASIAENVSLIKSIGSQYHTEIEGMVMRSVAAGRDLEMLTKELRARYGVTERRARLIARDQNNKATAAFRRARETALGLNDGIWLHSHGGKEPRPTHLANTGQRFDVRTGWYDPDPKVRRMIMPGELVNCRCTWKPIVKGFS